MTDPTLDMALARERFETATDFTVGLEEEFSLLDPKTLGLVNRYEELLASCEADPELAESVKGELIASEIEIRSGRGESFAEAVALQQLRRDRLFAAAGDLEIALGSMGTHPWADYREQRIIDTPHYNMLERDLQWVVRRNNTWSLHAHVGIQGADRAIAVCDHLAGILPQLLAASANSPFLDGLDTGLHSVRTEIFTRTFPRCGIPEPFGTWPDYASFVELLERAGSVVESTQLWWSVRPHHSFGTVEVRICDAQSDAAESTALSALLVACVAQSALDYDEGRLPPPLRPREVEENLWRAIRHGMDGLMVRFPSGEEVPTRQAVEELIAWSEPASAALGVEAVRRPRTARSGSAVASPRAQASVRPGPRKSP
jgi:carboxylate-amine ligase